MCLCSVCFLKASSYPLSVLFFSPATVLFCVPFLVCVAVFWPFLPVAPFLSPLLGPLSDLFSPLLFLVGPVWPRVVRFVSARVCRSLCVSPLPPSSPVCLPPPERSFVARDRHTRMGGRCFATAPGAGGRPPIRGRRSMACCHRGVVRPLLKRW